MIPYWVLFIALALGSLVPGHKKHVTSTGPTPTNHKIRDDLALAFVLVAITLMIGLRYRVGGDWGTYLITFRSVAISTFDVAFKNTPEEFAYTLINWLVAAMGAGFWLVNLICAIPFVIGLAAISRQQPNPWLALLVATPQFVIVVGMGYTRQAVAAGFMLIGIAGLARGRSFMWFVGWTLVASAFHTSAVIFIPVVAALLFRATFLWVISVLCALIAAYFLILPLMMDRYSAGYIQNIYEAKGAIFRIGPNVVAGLLLLTFRKQYVAPPIELRVWRSLAWLSVLIFIAFFEIQSTVILDRLSLYILPLQIFVLARFPTAFSNSSTEKLVLTMSVILFSALVLFFWLTFANHAKFWIPYRLYPF